ncbi:hypothetical protein HG530_003285 [Fusarium avenaceum]|nr:hypothetical protein HG530_003285 [Fusarium avenaceum]
MSTNVQHLSLQNSKAIMPRIGFGSYKIRGQTCKDAVLAALAAGYRHIDSAALYRNKVRVREAIEQSGVPREDVFLTTKVGSPRRKEAQGEVYQDVVETVDRIAGEDGYVDLLLIHVPGPSREHRQRLWEAMERVKKEGRAKSIGVSNFRVRHLEELREYATEWPPSVNQIELHPWCQQREVVAFCKANGIVVEAYSPLATGTRLDNTTVQSISTKHDMTPTQILIRYSLQKGAGLEDIRVLGQHALESNGRDVLAARNDDVLCSVLDLGAAVGMPHRKITRVKHTSSEQLPRGLGVLVVFLGADVADKYNLTDLLAVFGDVDKNTLWLVWLDDSDRLACDEAMTLPGHLCVLFSRREMIPSGESVAFGDGPVCFYKTC